MLLHKITDFIQPAYYKLEKSVASRQIPAVHEIAGRKKLADYYDNNASVASSSSSNNNNMNNNKNVMDHSLWNDLLQQYVDVSPENTIGDVTGMHLVDYEGMASSPKFARYLQLLAETQPTTLPEPEQLAFWMNAYNALCINKLIVGMKEHKDKEDDGMPLTSINDLSRPGNPVWDQEAGIVAGRAVSLNHIEHEQLRKVWDEPLVHACIVCASASCPNLRNEAFVGATVKAQMEDQFRTWMQSDSKGLRYQKEAHGGKRLALSRIFLWFGDDFGGWEGLRQLLPNYVTDKDFAQKIRDNKVKVRFFEYNWMMNRQGTDDGHVTCSSQIKNEDKGENVKRPQQVDASANNSNSTLTSGSSSD